MSSWRVVTISKGICGFIERYIEGEQNWRINSSPRGKSSVVATLKGDHEIMRNTLFASVAVGAISFSGAALATTALNIGVGANPKGPEFIITFGPAGAISTA